MFGVVELHKLGLLSKSLTASYVTSYLPKPQWLIQDDVYAMMTIKLQEVTCRNTNTSTY